MIQNKDNECKIDVDTAWDNLYAKLENERLLTGEPGSPPKIPLRWMAVAAVVCAAVISSIFYFPHKKENSLVFMQNKDSSGALVVTLEDSSVVYLASNASIAYPAVFANNQRKVKLNGNALFSVTKNKKRPFIIETSKEVTIEVVGTIFAVQSSPENPFELSVKEGKVNVHSKDGKNVVPLEAGETVQKSTSGLNKFKIVNAEVFSRFTNRMCFKDEKLSNIVHAINTGYGNPIVIADQSLNNRTLTVTFENDSVETMTQLICMALHLKQTNKQDTIFIRESLK